MAFSASLGTMVHECAWKWIPNLWDWLICSLHIQKLGFSMRDLPQEILIDILSRLPGDCVLECRRVCKQWLALTSTPQFVEMHLERATPVLFMQCVGKSGKNLDMFIFDEGARANQMIKKKMGAELMHFGVVYRPLLCGSCNGLLVVRPTPLSSVSFVCNPLTRKKVTIRSPFKPGLACGVFSHPPTKDYRLLFVHRRLLFAHEGYDFEYFLYSLGGQFWRKLGGFPSRPNPRVPPTILNGALHWIVNPYWIDENDIPPCSNSIMMFNMDTEEFHSMHHPGTECLTRQMHKYVHIFEMKWKLAFCRSYGGFVWLWVLEDYENWIWEERYLVNLRLGIKGYPFSPSAWISDIKVVDIQNDELLFDWDSRGIFRYNLRNKTAKQINGIRKKQTPVLSLNNFGCFIVPYTMTFVSPSGFE